MRTNNKHYKLVKSRAKTKKSAKPVRKSSKTKKNIWFGLLVGILLGILISSGAFIKFGNYDKSIITTTTKKKNKATSVKTNTVKVKSLKKKKSKLGFDFYTILPKMKSAENSKEKVKPIINISNSASRKIANTKVTYFIQVAMFDKVDEADALKAELTLEGFETIIKSVKKDNSIYYRIVMGPFSNKDQASQQQQLLLKQHVTGSIIQQE